MTQTVHAKAYLKDINIFCDRTPESLPPGVREYQTSPGRRNVSE